MSTTGLVPVTAVEEWSRRRARDIFYLMMFGLVDTQAMYEGIAGEENGHRRQPEATGYCMLEEHTGGTILRRGKRSGFEKKFGKYVAHGIESNTSLVKGEGFRIGNQAAHKYGLRRTLDRIQKTGSFPSYTSRIDR
ncbi:hypothetical protein FF2_009625 [Malus domestica]